MAVNNLGCAAANLCEIGDVDRIPEFRKFLQGYMAAFLNVYVQGSPQYLPAVSERGNVEEHVEMTVFEADVEC